MPPGTTSFCFNGKYGVSFSNNLVRTLVVLAAFATCLLACAPANAVSLFHEDFDGYTKFPDEHPSNDFNNAGLPQISEGADALWYGGRFETPDSGNIQQDLAVQQFGGSPNNTPVGRMEDDAGLLFNISTAGFFNVVLEFDWRMFSGGTGDLGRVGYYVGPITGFAGDRTKNMIGEWDNWTELATQNSNSWSNNVQFTLPGGQSSLWVAFWLDDGEGDFLKIDNIDVTGQLVPEPTTFVLAGIGGIAIGCVAFRRRRARNSAAARALCARTAREVSDVSAAGDINAEITSDSAAARAHCA
jgi:PEP-CTERM motif